MGGPTRRHIACFVVRLAGVWTIITAAAPGKPTSEGSHEALGRPTVRWLFAVVYLVMQVILLGCRRRHVRLGQKLSSGRSDLALQDKLFEGSSDGIENGSHVLRRPLAQWRFSLLMAAVQQPIP